MTSPVYTSSPTRPAAQEGFDASRAPGPTERIRRLVPHPEASARVPARSTFPPSNLAGLRQPDSSSPARRPPRPSPRLRDQPNRQPASSGTWPAPPQRAPASSPRPQPLAILGKPPLGSPLPGSRMRGSARAAALRVLQFGVGAQVPDQLEGGAAVPQSLPSPGLPSVRHPLRVFSRARRPRPLASASAALRVLGPPPRECAAVA
jgi:hypothetical protein